MTKQELIDRVYRNFGVPNALTKKLVAELVDGVFLEMREYFVESADDDDDARRFSYPGFGTFSTKSRPARTLRHPKTGDRIAVPETKTLAFSVGASLKSLLNE